MTMRGEPIKEILPKLLGNSQPIPSINNLTKTILRKPSRLP